MIGKTLSHYKVLEEIGEGGMGAVYMAEDQNLGRSVALKVVHTPFTAGASVDATTRRREESRLARFEREAKAIAALNHPNIVTIYSVESEGDVHYLTMELIPGKTLSEIIPSRGVRLRTFFDISIPLSDALRTAHESGITHRDLKPTNVMVTQEGRVKILDFGLAKLQTAELEGQTLTKDGDIIGTYVYMSPEQLQGADTDHRSDIFSLGIILFEMATGRRPFGGKSTAEMISSLLRDEPPSALSLRSQLPRHLDRILSHCLAKEPSRRFQSALDLHNQLKSLREELRTDSSTDRGEALSSGA